jgi:serine/threonine protein phosphatase 1
MFGLFSRDRPPARGPKGRRAYVIGDVHGRLDLLDRLLADIDADLCASPAKALLVLLGDLIDRGPQSAQVVERLRTYRREGVQPVFLLGNHEEVLLRILDGAAPLIARWRMFGGTECLMSYGVDGSALDGLDEAQSVALVRKAIPPKHVEFLRSFADTCRFGDYLLVHAGIRPGVELAGQKQSDLRWIRDPFLGHEGDHGFVVVHGHTISPDVEERPNRIGIDTGAYRSGVLTALVIDGEQRRLLSTASAGIDAGPPAN